MTCPHCFRNVPSNEEAAYRTMCEVCWCLLASRLWGDFHMPQRHGPPTMTVQELTRAPSHVRDEQR